MLQLYFGSSWPTLELSFSALSLTSDLNLVLAVIEDYSILIVFLRFGQH